MAYLSFRSRLRAFQAMRCDPPEPGFIADLEFLENRDLDLSIRLGAMLAFNALLITIGTHPVSASPGAPLSLDAPGQPVLTLLSLAGLLPLVASCVLILRAAGGRGVRERGTGTGRGAAPATVRGLCPLDRHSGEEPDPGNPAVAGGRRDDCVDLGGDFGRQDGLSEKTHSSRPFTAG